MKHPDQLLNRLDWLLSALTSSELGGPARQHDERLWDDFCSVASSAQQSDLANPTCSRGPSPPTLWSPVQPPHQPAEREDLETD